MASKVPLMGHDHALNAVWFRGPPSLRHSARGWASAIDENLDEGNEGICEHQKNVWMSRGAGWG